MLYKIGKTDRKQVHAPDTFVGEEFIQEGEVSGILPSRQEAKSGRREGSRGSELGSKAAPVSSTAIRYRSQPANTRGIIFSEDTFREGSLS